MFDSGLQVLVMQRGTPRGFVSGKFEIIGV